MEMKVHATTHTLWERVCNTFFSPSALHSNVPLSIMSSIPATHSSLFMDPTPCYSSPGRDFFSTHFIPLDSTKKKFLFQRFSMSKTSLCKGAKAISSFFPLFNLEWPRQGRRVFLLSEKIFETGQTPPHSNFGGILSLSPVYVNIFFGFRFCIYSRRWIIQKGTNFDDLELRDGL